jgi:hypothetical protein
VLCLGRLMKPAASSPWGKAATKMSSLPQARTLRKVPKMTPDMAQADVLAFTDRNREMLPVGLATGISAALS